MFPFLDIGQCGKNKKKKDPQHDWVCSSLDANSIIHEKILYREMNTYVQFWKKGEISRLFNKK